MSPPREVTSGPMAPNGVPQSRVISPSRISANNKFTGPGAGPYLVATGEEDANAIAHLRDQVAASRRHADDALATAHRYESARLSAEAHVRDLEAQLVRTTAVCEERTRGAVTGQRIMALNAWEVEDRMNIIMEYYAGLTALLEKYYGNVRKVCTAVAKDSKLSAATSEKLLEELRLQLSQNTSVLKQHATTIKALSSELVEAKQQAAAIASGYHKLDQEHKSTTTKFDANRAELKDISVQYNNVKRLVEGTEHLKGDNEKLGRSLNERSREVELLREQLRTARYDADRFKAELERIKGYAVETLKVSEGFDAATAYGKETSHALDTLRREYLDEKRRVERDAMKWKSAPH